MAEAVKFRNRATDVTRLEAFSDAVFGFALTLIVVSLEVPNNFTEMLQSMRGFVGFGICFLFLVWVWYEHYVFSRRYGLEDGITIVLNMLLLFVVLFYIYPLKFLFMALTGSVRWRAVMAPGQGAELMMIYAGGFIAVFVVLAAMYGHAYRLRRKLELNEVEAYDTVSSISIFSVCIGVGVVSFLIALIGGDGRSALSGWVYSAIGPICAVIGYRRGVNRDRVAERMLSAPQTPGGNAPYAPEQKAHGRGSGGSGHGPVPV